MYGVRTPTPACNNTLSYQLSYAYETIVSTWTIVDSW